MYIIIIIIVVVVVVVVVIIIIIIDTQREYRLQSVKKYSVVSLQST